MTTWNIVIYLSVAIVCFAEAHGHHGHGVTTKRPNQSDVSVVRIKTQGLIRGRKAEDGPYYEYTGIPYATASQENRFKSPLPVPTWNGVREANVEGTACPQFDETGKVVGKEDCLILNLYAPENSRTDGPLPVMVFIHGGSYIEGSGDKVLYGPKRFMEENVILITFNYRLSILGFLCTGDTANDGLKDAVAVLEWVQANIEAFGGDPRKVTVFGQSAGAAMVELLMLSKRAKGLFVGAIALSGLSTSEWAFGSDPEEKARRAAKQLGYEGNDVDERMRVLKNASLDDLMKSVQSLAVMTPFEFIPVTPCVEPASNPGAIVLKDPRKSIRSGDYNDLPYMQGFTKDEAMILYGHIKVFPTYFDMVRDHFPYTLPKDLQPLSQVDRITDMVKQFYFNGKNISEETMTEMVQYLTDVVYALRSVQTSRGYVRSHKKAPVYMYEFDYDGGMPFLKLRLNITNLPGVCHADDLGYTFTQTGYTLERADDLLTARRLIKLWTNFAKFSDPTPETSELLPVKWTPMTEDLEYLIIDRNIEMRKKPFTPRIDFWDGIYREFSPESQCP